MKKRELTTELDGVDEKLKLEIVNLTNIKEEYIIKTNTTIKNYKDTLSQLTIIDAEPLKEKADNITKMKEFLRDYDKVVTMTNEINSLQSQSDNLTTKIQHARNLPAILLSTATMPIEGITVENSEILINGLPIDCLNEGESYKVAIEIAKAKIGELKVILVDGFEKFCTKQQNLFIQKAKESRLQFFITEVSDDEELTIVSL